MGFAFSLYLLFMVASLFIFYLVIKAAIDNSQATEYLRQIRDNLNALRQQNTRNDGLGLYDNTVTSQPESEIEADLEEDTGDNARCPGCGANVDPLTDNECRECGLRLK